MKRYLILLACMIQIGSTAVFAQESDLPEVEFSYYLIRPGMEDSLMTGGSYSGDAPVMIRFQMTPKNTALYDCTYTWEFRKDEEESDPFLIRYDTITTYTFLESGSFMVKGNYSMEARSQSAPIEALSGSETFTVSIPTSTLDFPNAFSPNNDGINDYYNAKKGAKSLIEFHAYIFNRWGQKLYEWTDPYTQSSGWNGKYNGRDVAQGVYFLYCTAKGADGRTYTFRKDVNLLRNFTEEGLLN